jgi:hypothetical protein
VLIVGLGGFVGFTLLHLPVFLLQTFPLVLHNLTFLGPHFTFYFVVFTLLHRPVFLLQTFPLDLHNLTFFLLQVGIFNI